MWRQSVGKHHHGYGVEAGGYFGDDLYHYYMKGTMGCQPNLDHKCEKQKPTAACYR